MILKGNRTEDACWHENAGISKFHRGGGSRAQELCESRGGRPGLPVPNKPGGFLWT